MIQQATLQSFLIRQLSRSCDFILGIMFLLLAYIKDWWAFSNILFRYLQSAINFKYPEFRFFNFPFDFIDCRNMNVNPGGFGIISTIPFVYLISKFLFHDIK